MGKITIIIKWIKSFKFIDPDKMTAIVNEQNMNNVKEIIRDNIVAIGSQKIDDIDSAGLYSAINISETEKWAILSTEIMQKQEVIGKLMKQNDEKEEILKNSKSELDLLKNKVQFIKEENENLQKRIEFEQGIILPNDETMKLIEEQLYRHSFKELIKRTLDMSAA